MFTSTGRPSNAFGGINFAALDKKTGIRSMIKAPADSMLVEFDYDSYHVRLVARLIGYDLPDGNLHEYFGRMYFNTDTIEGELYNQSKQLTFRLLYGIMLEEYRHIEFFQKVDLYRKQLWSEFKNNSYVIAPVSGRPIYRSNHRDMSSTKLFNYILQGYETDVNSIMIHQILTYLYNKKSKLILYTYDSFLFSLHKSDGVGLIRSIQDILTQFNFKVNCKVGFNYNNMKLKQI
jgi:hypothetical protein